MLRFALSPTADMHIGNLRVALFNHIISKQKNENLIIRIEDSNKEENIQDKDKEILSILDLFSIEYTQVLNQSDNIKYHQQIAMQMLVDKKAFNCFCSDEALQKDKDELEKQDKPYSYGGFCENLSDDATINCEAPFTVRIKKPNENISFTDEINGDINYKPFDVDSFIILNKNKTPTYNFACAVDDMISNISTIIRDDTHLINTAKQIHIRNTIGYDKKIQYIHLPMIENNDDSYLTIPRLIEEGYLPIAIANYLVLLGYNAPCEIFTIEEAISWFDITKVSKSSSVFDIDKLNFINSEHIKTFDDMRLSKILGYADTDIGKLAKIYLEESNTIKEIKNKINAIFNEKKPLKDFEEECITIKNCLSDAPFITDFNDLKNYLLKNTEIKEHKLLLPLQYMLTGATNGPKLSEIYPLIKNYLGEIIK